MELRDSNYYQAPKLVEKTKIESNPYSNTFIEQFPKEIFLFENVLLVTHDMNEVIRLCKQPYYIHKDGCPNLGKKEGCPPVLHIEEEFDLNSIHLLTVKFPLGEFVNCKREKHPNWSNRALINQRHWQGHLKRLLNTRWDEIKERYPEHVVIYNPEAKGVNVEKTLHSVRIDLDWPRPNSKKEITHIPEYVYHVYFLGKRLKELRSETSKYT
jgi:hypothetical protein